MPDSFERAQETETDGSGSKSSRNSAPVSADSTARTEDFAAPEMERSVLACVLADPDCINTVSMLLGVHMPAKDSAGAGKTSVGAFERNARIMFRDPKHAEIYQSMLEVYSTGRKPDLLSVEDHLRRSGRLEMVGGADALLHRVRIKPQQGTAHKQEDPDGGDEDDAGVGGQGPIGFHDPTVIAAEDFRIPVSLLGVVGPQHQQDDVRIPREALPVNALVDIRSIGIETGRGIVVSEIADFIILAQLFLQHGGIALLPGIQQRESPGDAVPYACDADHGTNIRLLREILYLCRPE